MATDAPDRRDAPSIKCWFVLYKEMAMKTISLALLASMGLMLGGCNTVEGMGRDLKALANKIDGKPADQSKPADQKKN